MSFTIDSNHSPSSSHPLSLHLGCLPCFPPFPSCSASSVDPCELCFYSPSPRMLPPWIIRGRLLTFSLSVPLCGRDFSLPFSRSDLQLNRKTYHSYHLTPLLPLCQMHAYPITFSEDSGSRLMTFLNTSDSTNQLGDLSVCTVNPLTVPD